MSSTISKVVLAGATGSLGAPVLQALIDAKYDITVFTRANSSGNFPPSVKVAAVDYENVEGLTKALQGQDALISTLGAPGTTIQKNLVDAAVAAGIKRFVPSEFGCDLDVPANRSSPVYAPKVEIQEYIQSKVKGTATTYTYIYNNAFLDWGLQVGFLIDGKGKKATVYDDGETKVTLTPLSFVGKGVAAVLQKPEETANRSVRLHGVEITYNELLALVQDKVGKDGWEIERLSVDEEQQRSLANLQKDAANFPAWGFGLLKVGIFGKDRKSDFAGNNDNKLLGLKELSKEEVKEAVNAAI